MQVEEEIKKKGDRERVRKSVRCEDCRLVKPWCVQAEFSCYGREYSSQDCRRGRMREI
jgi:hypothetical protein